MKTTVDARAVRPVKKYWCTVCNRQEWNNVTPIGWYAFSQSGEEGWIKLGIYCSLACLLERVGTLERNERRVTLLSRDV